MHVCGCNGGGWLPKSFSWWDSNILVFWTTTKEKKSNGSHCHTPIWSPLLHNGQKRLQVASFPRLTFPYPSGLNTKLLVEKDLPTYVPQQLGQTIYCPSLLTLQHSPVLKCLYGNSSSLGYGCHSLLGQGVPRHQDLLCCSQLCSQPRVRCLPLGHVQQNVYRVNAWVTIVYTDYTLPPPPERNQQTSDTSRGQEEIGQRCHLWLVTLQASQDRSTHFVVCLR